MGGQGKKQQGLQPAESARTVTLQDVAQAAGVTLGTASKAINGRGKLSLETRERVRNEAQRLGFRLRDLEQHTSRNRFAMVGVLSSDFYGRFSLPLLAGIEEAFTGHAISAVLCTTQDQEQEQTYIQMLLERQVDGFIVSARREDTRPQIDLMHNTLPVVYAHAQVADPTALCVLPDDAQGARLAIEHLIAMGRRQFAHITGPGYFEAVRLREGSMRQVLVEHAIPFSERRALSGPWYESWGYTAAQYLIKQDPSIDALFCGSDQLARGAMEALHELGVRIPDDIAIVGFDNWEPFATATRPALTTVDMNLHEVGKNAGLALLDLLAGHSRSGITRLPCQLVIRASTSLRNNINNEPLSSL